MVSIDPNSAIWGYGFGRAARNSKRESNKKLVRGRITKNLYIKPFKSESGKLLIRLENTGNVTIGFDDATDDPASIGFNKIIVRVYELLDKPIQEEKRVLGLFKRKRDIDKKEVFKTVLSGLKPGESITLRTNLVVNPKKKYKIVAEEHYEEYVRSWSKVFGGRDLNETVKSLKILVPAKSYEVIEDFCKRNNVSVEEFLGRILEDIANQIRAASE